MVDKMAELRCQMCGKSNPEHLDECQYCGARLKPLLASSPPATSSAPADAETGADWADTSQEDTLGWLRSLGEEDASSEWDQGSLGGTSDLPPPRMSGQADWLGGPTEKEESAELDWMKDVGRGEFLDSGSLPDLNSWETPGTESSLAQWLPTEESAESEKDDWSAPTYGERPAPTYGEGLNSIGSEDSLTATFADWKHSPSLPQKDQGTDDLPTWLTSSPAEESSAEAGDFDSELPSWLSGGDPMSPLPSSAASESSLGVSSEPELEGEFPDWLDALNSKTGMTGKLGDMPQWLDEDKPATSETPDSNFDWLATLGDVPEEDPGANDFEAQTGRGSPSQGAGLPRDTGRGSMGGLTFDPEDSFMSEVDKGTNPDWLESLQGSEAGYLEPAEEYPGFQASWGFDQKAEQRAWQDEEQRQDESSTPAMSPSSTAEDSGIAGGLPSWVQAFRPMDGADFAAEYTEGELERVGPLAGLRGLLNPEADIAKTTKPSVYTAGLQVSTNQQNNTQLLRSLVESESIPQPLPEASRMYSSARSSQRILRVLIGVILSLVMLFPLISGTEIIPLPQPALPQEIQAIENLSNGLPLDRPILIAFDYEPGMSGELEVAAAAVFNHWMARQIPMALVSTSPLGTALGARQVAYVQSKFPYDHHYQYGEDYVNLGYIAGGTAGLANFALNPQASVTIAYDSRPVWELFDVAAANPWLSPVMRNITSPSDFSMTVVLTDNPETARNWIEQVEPALRDNSLIMIVSAQAEPFVRPYFQNPDLATRQVEGLLVGLRGGAAYEQDQGSHGLARLYWDTFGVGLLVAVVLILAGGGYNYLDELNKARKQARKGKSRK